ncbi:unnamed protein product [Anisakis simplex]|uniref:RRP12-like protein (inferred by orthology to a human protein) n=1 Tax=Anisakis simplex TaxID=6269 RepID=A0A158PNR3_ANISI|nr:unnamed protein product [Anisakis simplex]
MAGKFRVRVSASKLKKHIRKGASSESNPSTCRHRIEARNARTVANTAMVAIDDVPVNDTLLQLPLEDMHIGGDSSSENGESEFLNANKSMISEGCFSAFTACTNPTFDAVHRVWKSGSTMQNDVVAVLAAVAELIKEKGGDETDVEYFGALLSTLESTPPDECQKIAATAYLLNLIMKKINKDILQKYFSRAIQILYNKLSEHADSDNATLLKNLIASIGTLLRAQSIVAIQNTSTKMILASLATLSSHDKPWVRTMSRRALRAVLTDPVTSHSNGVHPAAAHVGELAISLLQQYNGKGASSVVPTRILCLLEGVMHKMASSVFRRLAETILRLMACADGTVKCAAMQCLYRVMQRQPCDAALPVDTNVQLILAIRDFVPPTSDVAVTAYWMQALGEAHVCLTAKDPAESIRLLPRTFEMFVCLFDLSVKTLAQVTMMVLRRLLERCVQKHATAASYCVDLLEKALNVRSVAVWSNVLSTQMKAFEECADAIQTETLNRTLNTLAKLRESQDCFCKGDLDLAVGAAIRYVGLDRVLHAIPLDIDPDVSSSVVDFKRSWLLPVMRVNIHNASLSIFVRFFLPLAIKLHKKTATLDTVTAKIVTTLQHQIWELLPVFLNSAVEFEKYFPELAPILGSALTERADLRMIVLSSIRNAVRFAQQPDAPPERMEVMQRYAKNYLPILFNMYTLENKADDHTGRAVHLATLETIRIYVELTSPALIERYIRSAVEKAHNGDNSLMKKLHILDVLGALAKRANAEGLSKIFDAVHEWFFTEEASLQKKAFRNLEEIMKRNGEPDVQEFFIAYGDEISNILNEDCVSRVARSARASLISILHLRLQQLSTFDAVKRFTTETFAQVVICLDKTHNTHTRTNAFRCLSDVCQRLLSFSADSDDNLSSSLELVLNLIYELATSKALTDPTEVPLNIAQSTMVALNMIAQKYVRKLNAALLNRLLMHACSCIRDRRPVIRVLVVRLIRVLTHKLPDYVLQQYKELIIEAVFENQLTADVTQKVRKANRLLLEEMVDKFGVETLMKSTDKSDWLKQLKAIEKIRRRRERRAEALLTDANTVESEVEDDEDTRSLSSKSARTAGADTILDMLIDSDQESDSGVDSDKEERKSRSGRSSTVWLREGDDEDMVDLLDRETMIGKVTTVKPSQQTNKTVSGGKGLMLSNGKKAEDGFKLSKDGKLIIQDIDALSSGRKRRQHDDVMNMVESSLNETKKKRTVHDAESEDDDEKSGTSDDNIENASAANSRWKPGGMGIHRDTRFEVGKTGGDVRKKGEKFEPYAYIPLRKQKGAATKMHKLIAGARKGASKGLKSKRRRVGKADMLS